MLPAFPESVYRSRLNVVAEVLMRHKSMDLCLVTEPSSICYLTGFCTPGNCLHVLLLRDDASATLVTRDLEASNAPPWLRCVAYTMYDVPTNVVAAVAPPHVARAGVELRSRGASVAEMDDVRLALQAADVCDISGVVDGLRCVKVSAELEHVRRAAQCVDEAYEHLNRSALLRPGVSETEIAGFLTSVCMRLGAEYTSYPCFVASGTRGCIGHHAASRKLLVAGEPVFVELGASVYRYHAARMHTWFVGPAPVWFDRLQRALVTAREAGRAACIPGALARDVDAAMRAVVTASLEPGERMMPRSGYPIGIAVSGDWCERTFVIDASSEATLTANMTLHLIPWVQKEGRGAVGFSGTYVVRAGGAARVA